MHILKSQTHLGHLSVKEPGGRYRVDLLDADSGKVKQQYESTNYVTKQHDAFTRWLHGFVAGYRHGFLFSDSWQTYSPWDSSAATAAGMRRPAWSPFTAPAVHDTDIIATNFAGAEDTDDTWMRGSVSAWASKYKCSVPAAGSRGQINEAESTMSSNFRTLTWVWDWTTQQGNGTFQSLHMGGAYGPLTDSTSAAYSVAFGETGFCLPRPPAALGGQANALAVDPDNNDVYVVSFNATVGSTPYVYKYTAAQIADTTYQDALLRYRSIAEPASVCAVPSTPWSSSTSAGSSSHYYICWTGFIKLPSAGDFIIVSIGNNRAVRTTRFTTAGTLVYSNTSTGLAAPTLTANTTNESDAVYLGGKIYAVFTDNNSYARDTIATNPSVTNIFRFDPATGDYEASIPVPTGMALTGRIGTDGTNLWVSTDQGIQVLSTAGAHVSPYNIGLPWLERATGLDQTGRMSDTLIAPMSTNDVFYRGTPNGYLYHGSRMGRHGFAWGNDMENSSTAYPSPYTRTEVADLFFASTGNVMVFSNSRENAPSPLWYDGQLYLIGPRDRDIASTFPTGASTEHHRTIATVNGWNMFSRALLDTPVTKQNTQNMKITYELTLPDQWWQVVPNGDPMLNA